MYVSDTQMQEFLKLIKLESLTFSESYVASMAIVILSQNWWSGKDEVHTFLKYIISEVYNYN